MRGREVVIKWTPKIYPAEIIASRQFVAAPPAAAQGPDVTIVRAFMYKYMARQTDSNDSNNAAAINYVSGSLM